VWSGEEHWMTSRHTVCYLSSDTPKGFGWWKQMKVKYFPFRSVISLMKRMG
jgi:hypothetical protein